jgi:predicted enzyme related to lactoylglutathione lyase
MPEVTRYNPGEFCWCELATTDQDGAKRFYSELLGWKANDVPMGPGATYSMMQIAGKDAAAIYKLGSEESAGGVSPHWRLYIATAGADQTAEAAKKLGAKVLAEPFDVFTSGRMAVIQDPTGAVFCLWQAGDHLGARIVGEPGAFSWAELDTRDVAAAKAFYTALFNWTINDRPDYNELVIGGREAGGLMAIPPEWGPAPPSWLVYFATESCGRSVERAQNLGAATLLPMTAIPGTGRFAVLRDPQGAAFALYEH